MRRKTVILFLLRFTKMVFSVISLSLAAKYFGVSLDRDMWLIALNCIVVVDLALWGPINETFRAKFVMLKETMGESAIMERTRALLVVIAMVSSAVVIAMLFFPIPIAQLLAPAYRGDQLQSLALMLMAIAPSLLLNQFCQIGISILNAYESFFIPEISNFFAAIINILSLIFLAPLIGIFSLMVSYYIGLSLLLLLLGLQIYKRKIPLFENLWRVKLRNFYPFFLYALPFFIPYFFIQVNLLIEKSLGNLLGDGIVSVLDYSRKFVDIPINVLTSVLLTMLVPVLAAKYAKHDHSGFLKEFKQLYQLGLLVVAALVAFFCSSSHELITVILFHDGQITSATVAHISELAIYYAWTALVGFFYIIYGLALLSADKGKVYAFFGVIAQFIMIVINLLFYRQFGAYTFPVSFIIAHTFSAIALFLYFPQKKAELYPITIKYMFVFILLVAIPYFFNGRLIEGLGNYTVLILNVGVIGLVFLCLLFVFKLEERLFIMQYWKKLTAFVAKSSHDERTGM